MSPTCMETRYNQNMKDLNRNFPDAFQMNNDPREPETEAAMNWIQSESFVLSANFHGGAVVASYPYDNSNKSREIPSPDDDFFQYLAHTYSNSHTTMHTGVNCGTARFVNGITNGFTWYTVQGGMQDYNYVWGQCFEITIEISCCKYPPPSELPAFWTQNKPALLEYMKQVHLGVKGQVLDVAGTPVPNAKVEVLGRTHICPYMTNQYGEYYLLLLPGTYTLNITLSDSQWITKTLQIPATQVNNFSAMKQNFEVPFVVTGTTITVQHPCTVRLNANTGSSSSITLKPVLLLYILTIILVICK
ncbi:carboxypeptidase M isoform X5 [Ambystoma mexicanum]